MAVILIVPRAGAPQIPVKENQLTIHPVDQSTYLGTQVPEIPALLVGERRCQEQERARE